VCVWGVVCVCVRAWVCACMCECVVWCVVWCVCVYVCVWCGVGWDGMGWCGVVWGCAFYHKPNTRRTYKHKAQIDTHQTSNKYPLRIIRNRWRIQKHLYVIVLQHPTASPQDIHITGKKIVCSCDGSGRGVANKKNTS
jgi:hypothetical protein